MNYYHEDTDAGGRLYDRDVFRLIFRYVLKYKKYLLIAVSFILLITGSNLLVPYLLKTLIDRHIFKQGRIIALDGALYQKQYAFLKKRILKNWLNRSLSLGEGKYFLFQSQTRYLSKREQEKLIEDGALSKSSYLLVEFPEVDSELTRKVMEAVERGDVLVYKSSFYLFRMETLAQYTVGEMARLRVQDFTRILRFVMYIIAALLIQFGASYLQIIYLMKLSQYAMKDLRIDLFNHLLQLEVSFFDRNPIGKLVNRVTNDIETLNELFSSVLITLFQDILMMAGIALIMFLTDLRLALIAAVAYPFVVLFTILFRVQARNAYRLIRSRITELNSFLNETITGIRIIQIFVREASNLKNFFFRNMAVYRAQLKELYANATFRPLISFLNWFSIAAIIYFGARGLLMQNRVSFGLLLMFIAYIERFFAPVQDLSEKFDIMQSATAAGEKLIAVFQAEAVREGDGQAVDEVAASFWRSAALVNMPPTIGGTALSGGDASGGGDAAAVGGILKDPRSFDGPLISQVRAPIVREITDLRFKGEIEFEDVWFSYKTGEWVLKGISFKVEPEQTVAIVGETGAGKTTIINILAKFHRVQKGKVLIDGLNIDDLPYNVVRSNVVSVMQDVFLFSRTVRENITLGLDYDERWFKTVCRATHVDRFIERLPGKELEPVMERGATFSAGERQLISFARALYVNPSILVLDEATSNIDTETEKLIQDAILHLTRGRTSIVIAHRLSTVKHADKILVLERGKIVEQGKHEELLAKKGIYHKLYTLQFSSLAR